jgi:1-acyl-sn-glycerol-3-phosphate acyltransferase
MSDSAPTLVDDALLEALILEVLEEVVLEVHPGGTPAPIRLDSALEREAGIDSLGRIEVLQRLERRVGVRLPERAAVEAETPRDLLVAVQSAQPALAESLRRTPPAASQAERDGEVPEGGTLTQVLAWHVARHPTRTWLELYGDGPDPTPITYADLDDEAGRVAAGLRQGGLLPGDSVALMLPTGREFFAGFFGALLAGGVPVPIYPPHRPSQLEEHLRRQVKILANARARVLITVPAGLRLRGTLVGHLPRLREVLTVERLAARAPDEAGRVSARPDDVAFLQYTSGSTGDPKGVILTHADLLANIHAMGQAAQVTPRDVFVSWLPLYHDMGLIGASLGSLVYGFQLVLLSPVSFITHPRRWLEALHRHRGTISAAPNFAYGLVATKLTGEDLVGLDLSAWRLAFNGAEPVDADTLVAFADRLAPCGFRAEALLPVYGLAEAGLGVTFPPVGRGPRVDTVEREVLLGGGRAVPAGSDGERRLQFVSCGPPLPGYGVRIVDERGREVGEREVGRVQFRGPSATQGYFRNPEATARLRVDGDWLDTGDNGYLAQGELHVTGRVKDLIIKAGHNLYPEELEAAVGDLDGIRRGCVAVFGVPDPRTHTDRLVVLAETREVDPLRRAALSRAVVEVTQRVLGIPPDDVVIAAPHSVRKTSSGKVRRSLCRELYLQGGLERSRAMWWQLLRLNLTGLPRRTRRGARRVVEVAYAAWFWTACWLVLVPALLVGAAIVPGPARRRAFARWLSRVAMRLLLLPLRVEGREHMMGDTPRVLVSNHASYIDSLVLAAVLPGATVFVAKGELTDNPLTRFLISRLSQLTVERFDVSGSLRDTERVASALTAGRWPVFFAEGTFVRPPGLHEFRLGAFVVAARAGAPVVPVALRGTRALLPEGSWLPRRMAVEVRLAPPVVPVGASWGDALALRDAVRAQVLARCSEPDMIRERVKPLRPAPSDGPPAPSSPGVSSQPSQ